MQRWLIFCACMGLLIPIYGIAQKGGGGKGAASGGGGGSQSAGGGQSGSPGGGGSAFFETQMLAYGGANELAYAISRRVCDPSIVPAGSTVIIYDQVSFQNLQAWQAFKAVGATLESAYGTIVPPPANNIGVTKLNTPAVAGGSAASPASFFAGSDVSNLVTALAANTTNAASNFTIPDSVMAVALLHQARRISPACSLTFEYYPLKGNSANSLAASSALHDVIEPVNTARARVQLALHNLGAGIDVTKNVDYLVFSDVNTQYDQWLGTLITSVGQNQSQAQFAPGPNVGISSLLQGAELEKQLADSKVYILYVNVVAAGGTQRDRKNLFSLFVGDFITYSGGLIANFGVINPQNNSIAIADVLRYRTPNTRLHKAHESDNVESTDSQDNVYSLCAQERRAGWPGGASSSTPCNVLQ